ncbi:MAG: TonB-dependent receptor, partial [Porphyromonadaceae bacterium]|nr:TonB-dependent receptor [Porphyromonadaceae bacterium]
LDAAYTIESSSKWIDYATFNLGLTGTGPFNWMDNNEVKQNFYPILNLKASVTKGNITWEVWSKNTTNTHFMSNYFELGPNKYGQKGRPFSIGTSILIDL